jgi:ferrochelatase
MEILPYLFIRITWQRRDRSDAFPLYPMPWHNYNFRIGWRTQTKIFPGMKFTIVPHFTTNLTTYKPWFSIKGHLEGYDYDIFYFPTTEFRASHSKTDITKSHCKIDGSCLPSPAHEFCYRHQCYETTKQVVKLLGQKENTAKPFNHA